MNANITFSCREVFIIMLCYGYIILLLMVTIC